MGFRLVPKSVTFNGLERRYFSEFAYLPGVRCKSSRSLSHLLMSSCITNIFYKYRRWKSLTIDVHAKVELFGKRPLTGKFSKKISERIHHLSDPRLVCKFREI